MKRFTIKSLMLVCVTLLSINTFAGDGTKDNPYTVAEATAKVNKDNTASEWVKGYIVGGVTSDTKVTTVSKEGDVIFSATGVRSGAIVIADNQNETNYENCFVIGFGSDSGNAKAALNLVDNADVLGKEVSLYGVIKGAFSFAGMKTITDYVLEGGTEPKPEENVLLEATFTNGNLDGFSIENVTIPEGGSYVWTADSEHGYMKASAYIKENKASEGWLISPALDLTGKSAVLTFRHVINFLKGNAHSEFTKVLISTDYTGGNPNAATWNLVENVTYPAADGWSPWTDSGEITLPENANVHFAFEYISTTAVACTWEIDNVKVVNKNPSSISSTQANTLSVYAADGVVYVPATAGQNIVVTNVAGQVVANVVAESDVTAIDNLPANQVLLVKAGNQVAKVIR